jgi:hypothetical protein
MAREFIAKKGLIVSGSTLIEGNIIASSLTGSLLGNVNGTASFATTAQNLLGSVTSAATASFILKTVTGTNSTDLVYGNMADNDQFRIRIGGTATNAGFAEIATADDGTEPIYVRQYTGVFSSLTRTATLLDGSGNTSFPGGVTATSFTGPLTGTGSWAVSASFAVSSSRAITASFAVSSSRAITASFAVSSLSASYAPTNQLYINNQGASYALASTDADKLIEMNSAAPNTLTVPTNASVPLAVGTQIMVVQQNTGPTTIAPAGGVTLNSAGGLLNLASQYSAATLVKRAVDEWYVFGDLA